jgi:hypothetical protein
MRFPYLCSKVQSEIYLLSYVVFLRFAGQFCRQASYAAHWDCMIAVDYVPFRSQYVHTVRTEYDLLQSVRTERTDYDKRNESL